VEKGGGRSKRFENFILLKPSSRVRDRDRDVGGKLLLLIFQEV